MGFGSSPLEKGFVGSSKGWEGIWGFLRVGMGFGGSPEGLGWDLGDHGVIGKEFGSSPKG